MKPSVTAPVNLAFLFFPDIKLGSIGVAIIINWENFHPDFLKVKTEVLTKQGCRLFTVSMRRSCLCNGESTDLLTGTAFTTPNNLEAV